MEDFCQFSLLKFHLNILCVLPLFISGYNYQSLQSKIFRTSCFVKNIWVMWSSKKRE